jgi:hypothetical protein
MKFLAVLLSFMITFSAVAQKCEEKTTTITCPATIDKPGLCQLKNEYVAGASADSLGTRIVNTWAVTPQRFAAMAGFEFISYTLKVYGSDYIIEISVKSHDQSPKHEDTPSKDGYFIMPLGSP